MTGSWIERPPTAKNMPAGLVPGDRIEFRLAGDPAVYEDRAGNLNWMSGPGAICAYRCVAVVPAPTGVGDVLGTALGSAARFNAEKPDLSLIPASILSALANHVSTLAHLKSCISWPLVLHCLGEFQMRQGGRSSLLNALSIMDFDGRLWADCARVFSYGKEKYCPWNWARGQAWSIPIASALRHIVFGTLVNEDPDLESGLPHRGHIACNIVMLLWFIDFYPEGDDRFTPPADAVA